MDVPHTLFICSVSTLIFWIFSVSALLCLTYPLASWALSYLCSNQFCPVPPTLAVQIVMSGGNVVFFELRCPEHHPGCLTPRLYSHGTCFLSLNNKKWKKTEESLKRCRSEALTHRHFRGLGSLSAISKIIARWVKRRGDKENVCKIFHNKMENNQSSDTPFHEKSSLALWNCSTDRVPVTKQNKTKQTSKHPPHTHTTTPFPTPK